MYYEEPSQRFNRITGLLSGAVLGAGLALLLRPEPKPPAARLSDAARRTLRSARREIEPVQERSTRGASALLRRIRR